MVQQLMHLSTAALHAVSTIHNGRTPGLPTITSDARRDRRQPGYKQDCIAFNFLKVLLCCSAYKRHCVVAVPLLYRQFMGCYPQVVTDLSHRWSLICRMFQISNKHFNAP